MKKIILAVMLTSTLMAAGNEDYFGLSAGKASSNFTAKANPGYVWLGDTNSKDAAYNFTLGHYYGEKERVSATYTYVKSEAGVDASDALTVGYDFILPLAEQLSIYAGPSVGYTRLKYDGGTNLSGFHYGAQAGGIVKVAKNIEIEAGYRYLLETGNSSTVEGKVELDNVGLWYIGGNIRF